MNEPCTKITKHGLQFSFLTVRPSTPPRHRSMPLPPYQPPYIPEHRTPPPPLEYGYPPLGIIPILLSLVYSLQNTGLDPMSLGNHLRSVLTKAKESETFLQTLIEIKDTDITTRRNK